MMDISDFNKMLKGYEWRERRRESERNLFLQVIRWSGWVSYAVAPKKGQNKQPKSLLRLPGDMMNVPLVTREQH